MKNKAIQREFTANERKTLSGLSTKLAQKHGCSSMYVLHIIHGTRGRDSVLAQKIIKDVEALLRFFSPKT